MNPLPLLIFYDFSLLPAALVTVCLGGGGFSVAQWLASRLLMREVTGGFESSGSHGILIKDFWLGHKGLRHIGSYICRNKKIPK